jgi:hypothetical protein
MHLGWWFGLWVRFVEMNVIEIWAFFFWFLIPASLYAASRLLIPEFPEGSVPDIEKRFDEVRIPFFACIVLATAPVLPSLDNVARIEWLLGAMTVFAITGMFVSNRRGHIVLLCLMLITFLTFLTLGRSSLGK